MNESQYRKSERAKKSAHEDLLAADLQAAKVYDGGSGLANPFQKKIARQMRRDAKRRMSKADRRSAKFICKHSEDMDND